MIVQEISILFVGSFWLRLIILVQEKSYSKKELAFRGCTRFMNSPLLMALFYLSSYSSDSLCFLLEGLHVSSHTFQTSLMYLNSVFELAWIVGYSVVKNDRVSSDICTFSCMKKEFYLHSWPIVLIWFGL